MMFMTTVRRHGSDDKERARQIVENGFQTIFFADARAKNGVVFDNQANVHHSVLYQCQGWP